MIEVDKALVRKWGKLKNQPDRYFPLHIDVPCPNIQCKRSLVNFALNWRNNGLFAFVPIECASCGESILLFLITPPKTEHPDDIEKSRILIVPPQHIEVVIPEEVEGVSPDFVEIYTQATKAEALRLNELNGIGYRKALEFLIKDYLCDL